jgi:hypothetical protein
MYGGPVLYYWDNNDPAIVKAVKTTMQQLTASYGGTPYRLTPNGQGGFAIADAGSLGIQSFLLEITGNGRPSLDTLKNDYYPRCRLLLLAMFNLMPSQPHNEKQSSAITIGANPSHMTIRASTTISGTIIPKRANSNVAIWYKHDKADAWNILAKVTTDRNSQYSLKWTPSQTGNYTLKASWLGDKYTLPNETLSMHLVCNNVTSSISISTTSSSTIKDFKTDIRGELRDMHGGPISNEAITVFYRVSTNTAWTPITSVVTDNSGEYSASWVPTIKGAFVLKAEWTGNSTYSDAANTTNLNCFSYNDQYVFTVDSNSDIYGLFFNATDRTLDLSATGPKGTRGYARITVSKNLIKDISNVRAYLDRSQTTFTSAAQDDSWQLTFTYSPNAHELIVDLDTAVIPEFPLIQWLTFMITTLFALIVYRRRMQTKSVTMARARENYVLALLC